MLLKEPPTATRSVQGPQINPWLGDDDQLNTMGIKADIQQGFLRLAAIWHASKSKPKTEGVADTTAANLFVDSLMSLTDAREIQRARVDIFKQADRLFKNEDFGTFNAMLAHINVEALPLELLLTVARAASFAPTKLPARPAFYGRVRTRFSREIGEARTAKLLDALR
jgi:hypothetical protein